MNARSIALLLATTALTLGAAYPATAAGSDIKIDSDDLGGVVTGPRGPEAGVWVIAETKDLKTPFAKIVTTDDQGRYVLPDLPPAKYQVWVRGYGLVDSKAVAGSPGKLLNLTAVTAPTPAAAAEVYPPNYWFALIQTPAASEFPGTGPKGNGISPRFKTQQHWLAHLQENCRACHQLGNAATRLVPDIGNSTEAWAQRIQKVRENHFAGGEGGEAAIGAGKNGGMVNAMTQFGPRGIRMFANWTDRIAAGELPEAPPRPAGVERNLVISVWDWTDGSMFVHDVTTTDKRNPSINAYKPVYGSATLYQSTLDPVTAVAEQQKVPGANRGLGTHTPTMDQKGRVWHAGGSHSAGKIDFCGGKSTNKFAQYFPLNDRYRGGGPVEESHVISVYDPATKKFTTIPVCFSSQHLAFGRDQNNTLYFSGDTEIISWIDTKVYDDTQDAQKSQGWCPLVIDTTGDGKITPDRSQWISSKLTDDLGFGGLMGAEIPIGERDKKDTRISGYMYGINVSPVDDSVWAVKYNPAWPSGIVRLERGTNAPQTCRTEFFEPPKLKDGTYAAFAGRGIDIDSKGVAWVSFASGQLGSFDRRKCKVTSGPNVGQQCPEGWEIYDSPGPKIKGQATGSADHHYQSFVDVYDTFGLGKDVPMMNGTNSDSLLAFLPDQKTWVVMRVPYPMGLYARLLDGRIDDPSKGWKGRGLWANYGSVPFWHQEGGDENATSKVVQIQMRPDALAH